MTELLIGTSGYSYQHWRTCFYPEELREKDWLSYYARHFKTVELNVTFYRLPDKKAFETWRIKTPCDFRFAVKGSRYITHIKRLISCEEPLSKFFENTSLLEEKLACILWQFPHSMKLNLKRLETFIRELEHSSFKTRYSFEFRHPSWFCPEVARLLQSCNMNLCMADSPDYPKQEILTSDFIYLRFHGGKILYGSECTDSEMCEWARKIQTWTSDKKMLLCFFNNDACGFAVRNALKLRSFLEEGKV